MAENKETYHLMAVPKHVTGLVLEHGGRFMKLKNPPWSQKEELSLIKYHEGSDQHAHILDQYQHREFELLGETYVEEMSLCKAVFVENRGGFSTFSGTKQQVTCPDCLRILKKVSHENLV